MKKISRHMLLLRVYGILALGCFGSSVQAAIISLTPPGSLVIDGANVTQGKFRTTGLATFDSSSLDLTSHVGGRSGIIRSVEIDPAIIGSGEEHVLATYPGDPAAGTVLVYGFNVTQATPSINVGFISLVISADPDFTISLPRQSVPGSTVSRFHEVIDHQGNVSFFDDTVSVLLLPVIASSNVK